MQVVHVDRLLPCVSLPAIGDETEDEPDTDNQPYTPDQAQIPDEVVQDIPGLFEESTLSQLQDSQVMDMQEPDSQLLDTQDQGSQASRRSTRVRKLPASGAIYPWLRPCDLKHKNNHFSTRNSNT